MKEKKNTRHKHADYNLRRAPFLTIDTHHTAYSTNAANRQTSDLFLVFMCFYVVLWPQPVPSLSLSCSVLQQKE